MNRIEIEAPIDLDDLALPAGVTAEERDTIIRFGADDSNITIFALSWVSGVSASMVATLLYNAIKKKTSHPPKKITIERTQVEFERGEIARFIQERIEERCDE